MISVRLLLELVTVLERAGISRDAFLVAASLDPALLETPDARVTRAELYRLCELALDLTGDPALGLHWAARLSDRAFVPVSQLLAHATNLAQAFALLAQFSPLLAEQSDYVVQERGDSIVLRCFPAEGESPRLRALAAELLVGGFFRLVRSFSVGTLSAVVSFEHAAPPHVAEYERLFEGLARFEQPFTGLVLDRALLHAPSRTHDEDVREALTAVAEQRLLRVTQQAPYAMRARDFLVREGWPHRTDMKSVARALDISVRSLRRRLDEEGRSYNEVLSEAHAFVARRLVREGRLTVQEIAYEMGFSDTSAFYRAFKRWTGTTPNECREGLSKT